MVATSISVQDAEDIIQTLQLSLGSAGDEMGKIFTMVQQPQNSRRTTFA
jgi:hypothetical protein